MIALTSPHGGSTDHKRGPFGGLPPLSLCRAVLRNLCHECGRRSDQCTARSFSCSKHKATIDVDNDDRQVSEAQRAPDEVERENAVHTGRRCGVLRTRSWLVACGKSSGWVHQAAVGLGLDRRRPGYPYVYRDVAGGPVPRTFLVEIWRCHKGDPRHSQRQAHALLSQLRGGPGQRSGGRARVPGAPPSSKPQSRAEPEPAAPLALWV